VEAQPSRLPACRHSRRRAVIALPCACAAAVLTGCSTYGGSSDNPPAAAPPAATTGPATPPGGASATGGAPTTGKAPAGPPPLAQVGDIPVGGGKIFENEKVVITQPKAGTIKAFSVTCTHQGCAVTRVSGGSIECPCHGSKFDVADGSVSAGPASAPLPPVNVKVNGDAITLA
jgi:Rieske Fe-S protein